MYVRASMCAFSSALSLVCQPGGCAVRHMVQFTFGVCWQNVFPKGITERELQWPYFSLGHHGPSPLRNIFPLNLWHEEKLKPSEVAEIQCSLKVYFKKQRKR